MEGLIRATEAAKVSIVERELEVPATSLARLRRMTRSAEIADNLARLPAHSPG